MYTPIQTHLEENNLQEEGEKISLLGQQNHKRLEIKIIEGIKKKHKSKCRKNNLLKNVYFKNDWKLAVTILK